MSDSWGFARLGSVGDIGTQAMAPTVVEAREGCWGSVALTGRGCGSEDRGCGNARRELVREDESSSCVGKSFISGGEVTAAFTVSKGEITFEVGKGVFHTGAFAPITEGIGEHAGAFEVGNGGTDNGFVGDGIDGHSEGLARAELFPEVFNGLVRAPLAIELL